MGILQDIRRMGLFGETVKLRRAHRDDAYVALKQENGALTGTIEGPFGGTEACVGFTAVEEEDRVLLYLHAEVPPRNPCRYAFASDAAIEVPFTAPEGTPMRAYRHDIFPWWMLGEVKRDTNGFDGETQNLFMELEGLHYEFLPLVTNDFRASFAAGKLYIASDCAGLHTLRGPFLCIARDRDPAFAARKAYAFAREKGAITVPLRAERRYPHMFDGFGFCTWDCFYANVTQDGVIEKMNELRDKRIPVSWVIIDDGWLRHEDQKLTHFTEDPVKFPMGFKWLISKLKNEYGVKYVGVWHAFEGYWNGVKEGSPLYLEQKENLVCTPSGLLLPSPDPEKSFRFWDAWHTFLASQGVDFVKVDNQSSAPGAYEGLMPTGRAVAGVHAGLDRSVAKNFGGAMINCMGMDMENVFGRPMSALSRNSDDFFPRRENGFAKHIVQNVYNAMWHDEMYYCDFDMWWSGDAHAAQSAALRAVSGSPIYVSDEVGRSDPGYILPLLYPDGNIIRCDRAARPVPALMYTDCAAEGKLLRIYNTLNDQIVLGVFNISGRELTETFALTDVPGVEAGAEYRMNEWFTREDRAVRGGESLTLTLPADGARVCTLTPVKDGKRPETDAEKFVAYRKS